MQTTPRTLGDLNAMREASGRTHTFVKWAIARAFNDGSTTAALSMLERDPEARPYLAELQKAAVEAMSTSAASSASPLASLRLFAAGFLRLVALRAVLPRLLGARVVPPNVLVQTQVAGAISQWVGQAAPAPIGTLAFNAEAVHPVKMVTIIPVTRELARLSDPNALQVVETDLARAIADFSNEALLDPALDAIPEVRPASLTHGAVEIAPGAGSLEEDVALVLAALSGGNPEAPYLVMSPRSALFLSTQRSAGGAKLFPNLGLLGGDILGVPVLIASAGAGDRIVGVDASGIAVADIGLELDSADAATLQMSTTPTNAAGGVGSPAAPVPTQLVSLWQTNSIAIKATRFVNWTRRADAVAYLELSGSPLP